MKKALLASVLGAMLMVPGSAMAAAPDGAGPWADAIASTTQGKRADGTAVLPGRSDPSQALGKAEGSLTTGFYSLGFGGQVVLKFDNNICNYTGTDLDIDLHEATIEPYQPEIVDVYASKDGASFVLVKSGVNKDEQVALPASLPIARFVKLVDRTGDDGVKDRPDADGYDVDGVAAKRTDCRPADVTCRASALRIDLTSTEPFVANKPEDPCKTDDSALLANPYVSAAEAHTIRNPAPGILARASTRTVGANVPLSTGIKADVVTSNAGIQCGTGSPVLVSGSNITNGNVLGIPVSGSGSNYFDTPTADIYINKTIPTANGVTQRAIWVHFKGLAAGLKDVVIGEVKVGTVGLGNACAP